MTVDFIITTINKTKEEILSLLEKTNIKGHILVGNQGQNENSCYEINENEYRASVYNETSTGVSLNRNFLLSKSTADFVIFLDDDVVLNNFISLEDFNSSNCLAIRYNCASSNPDRPIKQILKDKRLKFSDVKSYGVWGIFFNRKYLLNNNLAFNEEVGPGRYINHGEDTLFLKTYLKSGGKIIQKSKVVFTVSQETSTWKDGDIERELISHGFIYKKIFGKIGKFYLYYYCFRHFKEIKKVHPKITFKYAIRTLKKGFRGEIN
ncbi:MAG: glycosyltransferase family 2 protein [Bacteroidales bacterium]|nr:glycosyltransferase family 2 protein [Bacteroidales bacterium]